MYSKTGNEGSSPIFRQSADLSVETPYKEKSSKTFPVKVVRREAGLFGQPNARRDFRCGCGQRRGGAKEAEERKPVCAIQAPHVQGLVFYYFFGH